MASVGAITATNNAEIDGLLYGTRWVGPITYSFPSSPSVYTSGYGSGEPDDPSFAQIPAALQSAISYAVAQITAFTNAEVSYAGTDAADIMVAQSAVANPTAWAYLPDPSPEGGDIWVGITYDYSQASLGNYGLFAALNLVGSSFGLKSSSDTGGVANVAVPSAHDNIEYTVESPRGYAGADPNSGYAVEEFGYSQTYMANDILALQTLYGANYSAQSGNTVYTWSPTTGQEFINGVGQLAPGDGRGGSSIRIFATIWDGGGVDTYDLSNYTSDLTLNLNPGAASVFSPAQLADLGGGHHAGGNVYNAYLYNNDARSYIDNATGGSGNDTIIGNAIANTLNGGSGNDYIYAGEGDDVLSGGAGFDVLLGEAGNDSIYGGTGFNYLFGGDGNDILVGSGGATSSDVNVMYGGNGSDDLYGGAGTNYFYGGAGVDTMFGGTGLNIFISSGEANGDVIYGGSGQNYVYGSNGGDTVIGGSGVDVFLMGAGADNITGGGGVDYAWGGGDSDTFTITDSTREIMVIQDFNSDGINDLLNFAGTSLHSFADVQAAEFYVPGINTTIISDAAGNAAWLIGLAPAHLDASMFKFS